MDFKLWRLAMILSVSVLVLVIVLVVGLNQDRLPKKPAKEVPSLIGTQDIVAPGRNPAQVGNDLSAFLQDDNFFDPESNAVLDAIKQEQEQLSLMITSVEKDMRIQILGEQGRPVKGHPFFVQLDGEEEYKDLDQDGVIYIGDLSAGAHSVKLMPAQGYRTAASETTVKVKDRVEYVPISDISLLIKTEDEIDAQAEDSGVQEAIEDADKTEQSELAASAPGRQVGIDVSKWQKEIEWDRVRDAGIEFAIIRAGYRGSVTGALVEDPYFRQNIVQAKQAGILTGVYFFTQAVNEVEAVEEASMVTQLLQEYKIDYPVFIDTEGAGGSGRADGLDVETRTLVCEAFCRTIENAGYRAGVYASRNWYTKRLETKDLEQYVIWLAEYRSKPLYQGKYQLWQHTSKGAVDGIAGNVDLNISYGAFGQQE